MSLTLALNSSVDGGANWTRQILSGGPGAGIKSKAAVTSFFSGSLGADGTAINRIYAFAAGNDGNLWAVVSPDNGRSWGWQNQGAPPATIVGAPDAVSRQSVDNLGVFEQDIYCYVIGSDGNPYVNFSEDNGGSWHWVSRGAPPTSALAAGQPSVLAYFDGTHQSICAFAVGNDQNLYANVGDDSVWEWQNLGKPLPGVSGFPPTALTIPRVRQRKSTSLWWEVTTTCTLPSARLAEPGGYGRIVAHPPPKFRISSPTPCESGSNRNRRPSRAHVCLRRYSQFYPLHGFQCGRLAGTICGVELAGYGPADRKGAALFWRRSCQH
jgi:hypothetical protein